MDYNLSISIYIYLYRSISIYIYLYISIYIYLYLSISYNPQHPNSNPNSNSHWFSMVQVGTQEQNHGEEASGCHMHSGKLHGVWKTALFHQVLVEGDQTWSHNSRISEEMYKKICVPICTPICNNMYIFSVCIQYVDWFLLKHIVWLKNVCMHPACKLFFGCMDYMNIQFACSKCVHVVHIFRLTFSVNHRTKWSF